MTIFVTINEVISMSSINHHQQPDSLSNSALRRAAGNERYPHLLGVQPPRRMTHARLQQHIAGVKSLCQSETRVRMPFDDVRADD